MSSDLSMLSPTQNSAKIDLSAAVKTRALLAEALAATPIAIILYSLFLFFLDSHLTHVRTSYTVLKQNLLAHSAETRILILGSSHSQFGINPYLFSQPALNLANVSQSLPLDRKLADEVIPLLPHLQLLIIPISYFATEYHLCDSPESWRDYNYYRVFGVSESPFWQRMLDPRYWSLTTMYGPKICRQVIASAHQINLADSINDNGLCSDAVGNRAEKSDAHAYERAHYHLSLMHTKYGKDILEQLLALLNNCRQRGIKVVLITIPTMANYRHSLGAAKIREAQSIIQQTSSLAKVVWQDYSNDRRFTDKHFHDCDHLNALGSRMFTQIIDKELVKPLLHITPD